MYSSSMWDSGMWDHVIMKAFAFYMKCRFGDHESGVMNNLMLSQWNVSVPGWWALREQKQILARLWWCQKCEGTGRGSVGGAALMHSQVQMEDWLWFSPKQLWCLFAQLWICSTDQQQQFIPSDEREAGSQLDLGMLSRNWITISFQKVRTGMDAPSAGSDKLGVNTWT